MAAEEIFLSHGYPKFVQVPLKISLIFYFDSNTHEQSQKPKETEYF
jgi:hypothetical protein